MDTVGTQNPADLPSLIPGQPAYAEITPGPKRREPNPTGKPDPFRVISPGRTDARERGAAACPSTSPSGEEIQHRRLPVHLPIDALPLRLPSTRCRSASVQRRRVLLLPRKEPLLHLPSRRRRSRTAAFFGSTTPLPRGRVYIL